jgi:hypothetical protein
MIEEIKTASIFKGAEWIAEMNSLDIINKMKDTVFPDRNKGGNHTWTEEITVERTEYLTGKRYDYVLTQYFSKPKIGTDMSKYPPKIDNVEYTWPELKNHPNTLLQIKLYRLLMQHGKLKGEEE